MDTGLHLFPEFQAREAARFAGYRWPEFIRLKPADYLGAIGHWLAHTFFAMHTQDAHALEAERRMKLDEARRGLNHG